MKIEDVKQELVSAEAWSGVIGNPPRPYLALSLTTVGPSGTPKTIPWTAVSPALAQRLIELLQTSLGQPQPEPPPKGKIH